MIRYHFSGHLTPKPKGTEQAMCALSGDVYLATDVEAHEHSQTNEITRLNRMVTSLQSEIWRRKQEIRELKRRLKGKQKSENGTHE